MGLRKAPHHVMGRPAEGGFGRCRNGGPRVLHTRHRISRGYLGGRRSHSRCPEDGCGRRREKVRTLLNCGATEIL